MNRQKREDCETLELPPRCATACQPAPLRRITYRACPVHTSDKFKFVGAKKTLESHSFGHGRSNPNPIPNPNPNPIPNPNPNPNPSPDPNPNRAPNPNADLTVTPTLTLTLPLTPTLTYPYPYPLPLGRCLTLRERSLNGSEPTHYLVGRAARAATRA